MTDFKFMRSILVLNSGSSTIKFSVFSLHGDEDNQISKVYTGLVDQIKTKPHLKIKSWTPHHKDHGSSPTSAVVVDKELSASDGSDPYVLATEVILDWLKESNIKVVAAGHRVAHGGANYSCPTPINAEVFAALAKLSPLAPLHQPYNLKGYEILSEKFPDILQIAAFDTSFHTTCNKLSQAFAIPKSLAAEGVRRYGFHGLSYEYVASQFDHVLPPNHARGKVIVAHLGQGTSMCAIDQQQSVATTLSFSAIDGLPMGTRTGNIDPGVLLYLMQTHGFGYNELERMLYKESGLLGLSGGISSDMRVLLASDHPDAKLAVDVFVYKVNAWIGMLAAELAGLDALVFTAGIGENAPFVRSEICKRAAWLGIKFDEEKNAENAATISAPDSKVSVHVIPTDEEITIAKGTLECLCGEPN